MTKEDADLHFETASAAQAQRVAEQKAREDWPGHVSEALRLLTDKVLDLQKRLAAVEAGRG